VLYEDSRAGASVDVFWQVVISLVSSIAGLNTATRLVQAGITSNSSKDFNERNLRFYPEWGNHNSASGNAVKHLPPSKRGLCSGRAQALR
jgi:hypothetical protein